MKAILPVSNKLLFRNHFINKHYQLKSKYASIWKQPTGYETPVKIYSCVAKTKVPLIVSNKHLVSWYTCGPTVYDDAHVGHASCYMRLDILQRILKHQCGLNIVSTMNITDIDDKIIAKSISAKVSVSDVSKEYEKRFWEDLEALHISRPDKVLKVTENMPMIIEFVSKLINDGLTYKGQDGSVYFNVKKYETINEENRYSKLQNISRDNPEVDGTKIRVKKSAEDFVLWKAAKPGEPSWEASFGSGRPGWHIECSAMASLMYGDTIDLHAGGMDLRFPHHENEEAQACAYHSHSQWVNYWLHTGYLHLANDGKMSKSLKNTISIRDFLNTGNPTTFRMACLLTNYKNNMEFSPGCLKNAEDHVQSLKNFITTIRMLVAKDAIRINVNSNVLLAELTKTIESVNVALYDDFDTARVIKAIDSLISVCNKAIGDSSSTMAKTDDYKSVASLLAVENYVESICEMFGVDLKGEKALMIDSSAFDEVMDLLVNFRHQLRSLSLGRKDKEGLALCDDVRNECGKLGISLKDHAKISTWNK